MQSQEVRLTERLQRRISRRETRARETVQAIYRWGTLQRCEADRGLIGTQLFTAEGWELFGLSQTKLLVSGALSGALAGGAFDALLGGASFLLGAGIGALVGSAGAWFGSQELARVRVLGESLGGRILHVGPVTEPNFPWVILGRAWVHHHLVSERNHARREALSLALADETHVMDLLPDANRRELGKLFGSLGKDASPANRRGLASAIDEVLALDPAQD